MQYVSLHTRIIFQWNHVSQHVFDLGVGPKSQTTEISAETETEISAEIDFGHVNFSAEIFKSNYNINQDIFAKFNYSKFSQDWKLCFLAYICHHMVAIHN